MVPLTVAVLEEYLAFLHEPEGRRLTGTHATFTRDQVVGYLDSRAEQVDRADWAALRISDGAFLGEAVVNDLDPENESASYRIALAGPSVFGQGFGTEVTRLVVDHVFAATGLHRLGLEVFAFNARARRVYEKCGFQVEGRLRDALLWDGERHDVLVMSVLRTDVVPGRG
nr:GNAT family protein [Modestobacter versicolor]